MARTRVPSCIWQTQIFLSENQKQRMKAVILSINLLSAGLFWAHNKTPPQVLLAAFLENWHRSRGNDNSKSYLGKPHPKPCGYCEGRGTLSLREALLSWWPTTLPSLSACSQTQDGKVADAEEEEGGFRGFQTCHRARCALTCTPTG